MAHTAADPSTPSETSESRLRHAVEFIVGVGGFALAGPVLILLNNQILKDTSFRYPIALSAFGVGFAAMFSRMLFGLELLTFKQPALTTSWDFYLRSTLPIASLSALTLALGNASYMYLSVAMCQMLKALTPAIALGLLVVLRVETPSRFEVACVMVITLGTLVTTRGELAASHFGLALQLSANFAEASRLVLSQRMLKNMSLPPLEMQYHVAPVQLLCLLAASVMFELHNEEHRSAALGAIRSTPMPFIVAGLLGLVLQVIGLLAVRAAGSVAVKLLGIARGAGLVLFEVLRGSSANGGSANGGTPSPLQLAG